MKHVIVGFGTEAVEVPVPSHTDELSMVAPPVLTEIRAAIEGALDQSIGGPNLETVIRQKRAENPQAKAVVVISDTTRPVPYRGEAGILWPIIDRLLQAGMAADQILVLVATGTHRALSHQELHTMIDSRVFASGVAVKNHDCRSDDLLRLGRTRRGSEVWINRDYMEADLKILTGLVESHFMAGASGGRKSVCPGIVGEASTYLFHGASMLADDNCRDLVLTGNPCHEEALEVAKMAGVDYLVNVTLDHRFTPTGVFAGALEAAHEAAVAHLKEYVTIPIERQYDLVITHGGFVGINHYQCAKAAVVAMEAVKPGGHVVLVADNTDIDPVGSLNYRTVLYLLRYLGPKRFMALLTSPDWTFIPEQWQVQMWAKVFARIPMTNFVYFSPQLTEADYAAIPGTDGCSFLADRGASSLTLRQVSSVVEGVVHQCMAGVPDQQELAIAYLTDGPYGIPRLS